MNFEGDRYSSAWAHIAHCADLTWTTEPPDDFIIANQRLWAQHCHVSQVLQANTLENSHVTSSSNHCELSDKRLNTSPSHENGSYSSRLSVKDVIPESRLAQYYGNFYYDDLREKCYTNPNEKLNYGNYNGNGCGNSDLTECWMLPEVEYWFRKLMDDSSEPRGIPRRRRQYRMLVEDDFERWDPTGVGRGEASLAARVLGVRSLWQRAPPPAPAHSPPHTPRKIRARRRQPRRLMHTPQPRYCLQPVPLLCDPSCKFQFDTPPPPQLNECQKTLGSLSVNAQAFVRASAARCPLYRGTNVSRYTPTSQRPARCTDRRYGIWCPRNYASPRINAKATIIDTKDQTKTSITDQANRNESLPSTSQHIPEINIETEDCEDDNSYVEEKQLSPNQNIIEATLKEQEQIDKPNSPKKEAPNDNQSPSTSSGAPDIGLMKKRLYSTVLSTQPINLTGVRLPQKSMISGLLKLNPKIVLPAARIRATNADNKFEELEKEALEQYKASDESIDTKFSELEKQAVEQYSTSNSNTSCSSGNSAEKRIPTSKCEQSNRKPHSKFRKDNTVDSVVIYSQNFPELNAKGQTSSMMNLKNFHVPPRGEKKEQVHRSSKIQQNLKTESQRAASDTDYEAKERKTQKGSMRWTLHVIPPKKRHLAMYASDTSDEECVRPIKDAGPPIKNRVRGKVKMSAHGGGDLHPIMRKSY